MLKYGRLLVVTGITLLAAALNAADCRDTDTMALTSCLRPVAAYTNGLAKPATGDTPLRDAIDTLYRRIQSEWTGPLARRTYLVGAYVVPFALLLMYGIFAALARRLWKPRYSPHTGPDWRRTRIAAWLACAILITIAIAERAWFRYQLARNYARIPHVVVKYTSIASPRQLADATTDPCAFAYSDNSAMILRCSDDYARRTKAGTSRLMESTFVDPILVNQLVDIGRACRDVTLIPSWLNPNDQIGRASVENCVVFGSGNTALTIGDFAPILNDVRDWLRPLGGAPTRLNLTPFFKLPTVEGDNPYQDKTRLITTAAELGRFRETFTRVSVISLALSVLALLSVTMFHMSLHRRELEDGSALAGRMLKRFHGVLLAFSLVTISLFWLLLSTNVF